MKKLSIPLIWVIAIFLNVNAFGQDQTYNICPGKLVQIKASDGSLGYKWDAAPSLLSPNSQATYISGLNATATFTVRSKITDGDNLVTNGDFELGNTGFTSQYTYYTQGTLTGQLEQGLYSVTSPGELANRYNIGFGSFGDHSGPGKMLIADGACGTNGIPGQATVWKQTIPVEPNTDYIFSSWMTNVALSGISSSLSFSINGAVIGAPTSTLTQVGAWGQFYVTWNSGSATTAVISIAEGTGVCGGNDFAVDDISFNKIRDIVETVQVIVGPPTETPEITGDHSLCLSSSTINLNPSIGGGTWKSSNTAVATVDANGKITAKSVGTTTITYTIGGTCGSTISPPFEVTVTASATTPIITGEHSLCLSGTINLTESVSGGTWTSSNTAVATVDAGGKITPVSVGTTNITYAITSSCGSATSLPFGITVNEGSAVPEITGDHSLCLSGTINLTSSATSGTWASSNTAIATIDATGKLTPVSAGKTNITYTVTSPCGNPTSLPFEVTVNAAPAVPEITGDNSLCLSGTINLTSSATGGTWASSNTAVVTIDATGKLTPVSAGKTNITYTVTSSCGNPTSLPFEVTVNAAPATPIITGDNSLCLSGTINLTSSATGGTWASSNTAIATIDATGKLTPVSAGKTNITYTVTSPCGNPTSLPFEVTVNASPATPVITGDHSLCLSGTINLTSSATGGTWASNNTAVATIDASGKVSPISVGKTNITYTVTSPCGNPTSLPFEINVNAPPATPFITGDNSLCLSSTIDLTSSATGGTWASSNTDVATMDATGKLSPVSAGKTNITYTVTSPCGNPTSLPFEVTVNALPQLGEITGTTSLATGKQSTLTINLPGGAWKSSDGSVVEITADGTIKGLKDGESEITYSLDSPCGMVFSLPHKIIVMSDDIYAPNAFTPNGDGKNDEFRIYGSPITAIILDIFNQWGERIFQSIDLTKGWTGTYKGEEQPAGVYIYTAKLKLTNGQELVKKGPVHLIR